MFVDDGQSVLRAYSRAFGRSCKVLTRAPEPGARRTIFVTADRTSKKYESVVSDLVNALLFEPVDAGSLLAAINAVASPLDEPGGSPGGR